ncbi:hypothetical protein HDU96_009622 [Phlyctochytrium bullatum]|nr:hypothetical protein HDU96_009622 [Phlyctochytrium bullatum]
MKRKFEESEDSPSLVRDVLAFRDDEHEMNIVQGTVNFDEKDAESFAGFFANPADQALPERVDAQFVEDDLNRLTHEVDPYVGTDFSGMDNSTSAESDGHSPDTLQENYDVEETIEGQHLAPNGNLPPAQDDLPDQNNTQNASDLPGSSPLQSVDYAVGKMAGPVELAGFDGHGALTNGDNAEQGDGQEEEAVIKEDNVEFAVDNGEDGEFPGDEEPGFTEEDLNGDDVEDFAEESDVSPAHGVTYEENSMVGKNEPEESHTLFQDDFETEEASAEVRRFCSATVLTTVAS